MTWIDWDSGFRGALQLGDVVVGDQGGEYADPNAPESAVIGTGTEDRRWDELGVGVGGTVELVVDRGGQRLSVSGTLAPIGATVYDAQGVAVVAEGGPARYEKDGFDSAWMAWYDEVRETADVVLSARNRAVRWDTEGLTDELAALRDRVAFLESKYPGPFAASVREHFDAMEAAVAGEVRHPSAERLAHRFAGPERAAAVASAADAAFAAFLQSLDPPPVEPFPGPDPEDRDQMKEWEGKVVRLPECGDRELLVDGDTSWYHATDGTLSYVVGRSGDATARVLEASAKYTELVHPALAERRFVFVGPVDSAEKVKDARDGSSREAVVVVPLGALVADAVEPARRFFVDARPEAPAGELFAGMSAIAPPASPELAADSSPEQVLEAFFGFLKWGNLDVWSRCFATWKVREGAQGSTSYLYVDPEWTVLSPSDASSVFDRARERLADDVHDVEITTVTAPRVVFDASVHGRAGGPSSPARVEEVEALVDHVTKSGDEYRTFVSHTLHRKYAVQRVDGGPWRVVTPEGL